VRGVRGFRPRPAAEFFEREADRLGHAPPVIDANDVLANPTGNMSSLWSLAFPGRGDGWLGRPASAKLTALAPQLYGRSRKAPLSRPRTGPRDSERRKKP